MVIAKPQNLQLTDQFLKKYSYAEYDKNFVIVYFHDEIFKREKFDNYEDFLIRVSELDNYRCLIFFGADVNKIENDFQPLIGDNCSFASEEEFKWKLDHIRDLIFNKISSEQFTQHYFQWLMGEIIGKTNPFFILTPNEFVIINDDKVKVFDGIYITEDSCVKYEEQKKEKNTGFNLLNAPEKICVNCEKKVKYYRQKHSVYFCLMCEQELFQQQHYSSY